jgi:hypothetical protein
MKTILNRIALALLITSLAGIAAFAKGKKETVNFPTDIKVNGTVVSSGTYEVKFDESTNELSIVKGSKVIAKATTSTAKRDRKAKSFEVRTSGSGAETQLTSVAFSGSDQNLVLSGSQASK